MSATVAAASGGASSCIHWSLTSVRAYAAVVFSSSAWLGAQRSSKEANTDSARTRSWTPWVVVVVVTVVMVLVVLVVVMVVVYACMCVRACVCVLCLLSLSLP